MWQNFAIRGTGGYLPRRKLSAADIEQRAGLPAGWVAKHTGVTTRYECAPPETLPEMAHEAVRQALASANCAWSDIDLILDGSTSRHQPIPCNAAVLQQAFGPEAAGIPCFDVQSTCLGFVVALVVANGLLATETFRRIVIVCAEGTLLGVDWSNPESATLMGDGAAAVVVERTPPRDTLHYRHATFAEHLAECQVAAGGHTRPVFGYRPEDESQFRFQMNGPQLFRTAAKRLPPLVTQLLGESKVPVADLHVIPHQASPRAVESVRRLLGFSRERFPNRVAETGNLAAASIPFLLHQLRSEGAIRTGTPLMLLGTSAGYSQAGLIFEL